MHRFSTSETKGADRRSHTRWLYLLPPALIIVFYLAINSVGNSATERQRDSLERALSRDIVHCYALEGFYPPSLQYIEEHYGLVYDHDKFYIDYRPIGSNIHPDVTIIVN